MLYIVIILIVVGMFFLRYYEFKKGSYHKITQNTFWKTIFDFGNYGEYQIYKYLCKYETAGGKFLFNCYLPKWNGETTEVDVILISVDGIFVFESKNYSGWIFGDEKSKKWTQTFPKGKGKSHKEYFFNPIMQNEAHIKYLKNIVGEDLPIFSIIVFSERCTLKKITVTSHDVQVIRRYDIVRAVERAGNVCSRKLCQEEIDDIYNKCYPFTQLTNAEKIQHVRNLKMNNN